jgi:hypothetical protein
LCELTGSGDVIVTPTEGTKASDEEEAEYDEPGPRITVKRKAHNGDAPLTFSMTVERTGPGFPPVRATAHFQVDNDQQGG